MPQRLTGLRAGFQSLLPAAAVDLRVSLGCGDELVAKGLLNEADVARLVVEPSGEGVPQGVGRDGRCDPDLEAPAGYDPLDLAYREPPACPSSEQRVGGDCPTCERFEPSTDLLTRYDLLWITAFSRSQRDRTRVPVDVPHVESDCLGESAACPQHERDQCVVSCGSLPLELSIHQQSDFALIQNRRG